MKTRFLSLLYFFVAAFVAPDSAFAGKDSAPSDFHAPQTDAEKALDKLLLSDKNNGGILLRPEGDVLPSKEDNEDRLYTPVSYTHLTLPTNREVSVSWLGDVYKRQLDKLLLSDKNNGGILLRPEGDVLPSKEDNEDRLYTPVSYTHLTLPTNREV